MILGFTGNTCPLNESRRPHSITRAPDGQQLVRFPNSLAYGAPYPWPPGFRIAASSLSNREIGSTGAEHRFNRQERCCPLHHHNGIRVSSDYLGNDGATEPHLTASTAEAVRGMHRDVKSTSRRGKFQRRSCLLHDFQTETTRCAVLTS